MKKRSKILEGRRSSYGENVELSREKSRERYANNPTIWKDIARRQKVRYPDRVAARNAVKKAKARGDLAPEPCEVCATTEIIEAHHDSYLAENHLNVRWLCSKHHKDWHRENPNHFTEALSGGKVGAGV